VTKEYSITPVIRPNKKTYSASFYNALEQRVTRSLKTKNKDKANIIVSSLINLRGTKNLDDIGYGMDPDAVIFYFSGCENNKISLGSLNSDSLNNFIISKESFLKLKKSERFKITSFIYKATAEKNKLNDLQIEYEKIKINYDSLKSSVIAQATLSSIACPLIEEAVKKFTKHLEHGTTKTHFREVINSLNKFIIGLPLEIKRPIDILPSHISCWIDESISLSKKVKNINSLKRRLKIRIGGFINWAAKSWNYKSQMSKVDAPKISIIKRSREEIQWHDLQSIIEEKERIKDHYWKTLFSVLVFAGLQRAELIFLKVEDIIENDKGYQIRISPTKDHALKRGRRKRSINVDEKLLLPTLLKYLDSDMPGKKYLFPSRTDKKQKKNSLVENWQTGSFNL
jgi:integrase